VSLPFKRLPSPTLRYSFKNYPAVQNMTKRPRSRRPPSLNLSLSSRDTSRLGTPSPDLEYHIGFSLPSEHDNTDDRIHCGEMRVFRSGSYCFKQPTLADVLSNVAPPPYTLSAFMAYLSQNHCLETLEFTMDANRYRKHYTNVENKTPVDPKERAFVRQLWQKLLNAYIVPNGPREVNLPCTIRDQILSIPNHLQPPPPEALDPAVNIIHDLMQESVLVPFLSECQHTTGFGPNSSIMSWQGNVSDESVHMGGSLDERVQRGARASSPPSPLEFMLNSYTSDSSSRGSTSPFSAHLGWHSRQNSQTPHSWASNCSGESVMLVNDSGSSTPNWGSPMTPPATPPTSEAILFGSSSSPKRVSEKAEKGWKRMTGGLGRGFGWGKKKPETGTYW
jgi:hypothetical protein